MSYKEVDAAGDIFWYNDQGELHREGEPAVEHKSGDKLWYLNGEPHRDDGPAIDFINRYREWWIHGELHREGGPAVEYSSGNKEWWLNGTQYSRKEYKTKMRLRKLNKLLECKS